MSDDEKLIGKTIIWAQIGGYGVELKFSDGSILDYSSSDGGYSSWEIIEDAKQAEMNEMSTSDVVEVKHGRWLTKEYMYGDPDVGTEDMWIDRSAEQSDYYAYCSICGKDAGYNGEGSLILSNYCPHCGTKMDGAEE